MKNLNISKGNGKSKREMSAAAWDKKVAMQQAIIDGATYRLSLDWCVGSYADNAKAEIAKAEAKIAKLMAVNPYDAS